MFWSGGSFQFAFAVSKTSNGGGNWNRTILGTVGDCRTIAIAPSNSNVIYAGGASSTGQPWLFKTSDAGVSWDTLTGLGADTTLRTLAVHPADPNIVFAGKANGVFRSTDGGNAWVTTGLANVRVVVIDPDAAGTVYAGTTGGVYVSTSGGGGWTAMNDGLANLAVTDLEISSDRYLVASTYGAGMYRWHIMTGVSENAVPGTAAFLTAYPNPARGRVTFSIGYPAADPPHGLADGGAGSQKLHIYDLTGKLVKDLSPLVLRPMSFVSWDGTDQAGQAVPSGVYFCRLSADDVKCGIEFIYVR